VRYLLIDRIIHYERDRCVIATKNVTLESDVLEHHFRGFPVFPGALTLESMAQAAAYLVIRSVRDATGETVVAALSSIERAHFRRPTFAGDQLRIAVEWTDHRRHTARVIARAEVDGETAARARLLLAYRPADPEHRAEVDEFVSQFFRVLERRQPWR
jgi:3-hydroxyacyl-[acyl-carrier-protein] dehydratase